MVSEKNENSLFSALHSQVREGLEETLDSLSDEEKRKFSELSEQGSAAGLAEPLLHVASEVAGHFLDEANKWSEEGYEEDMSYKRDYESTLEKLYRPYFIELHGLLDLCWEAIDDHREYVNEQKILKNKKLQTRYYVIIRLHARALRLCNEILSLMEAGYGTGALGRWRVLHELTSTISFLLENPEATELFLEHNKILSYEAMVDYNKYSDLLKHTPYTNREIAGARRMRNTLVKRYGQMIKKPYGWLSVYSDGRLNSFRDLEAESGQEHLRPYYRYASYGIHTNAKSLFTGEDYSVLQNEGVLLIGASDTGMAEVAQLMPISICFATTAILMRVGQNMGAIIAGNTILLKHEQLREAFASISLPDER